MLKYNSGSLFLSNMKDKNNSLKTEQGAEGQEQTKHAKKKGGKEERSHGKEEIEGYIMFLMLH